MTTTTDLETFATWWAMTLTTAICVKQKVPPHDGNMPRTGRLSRPLLEQGGAINSDEKLAVHVAHLPEVVVIGHGNLANGDRFVWRGTGKEFNETWRGD